MKNFLYGKEKKELFFIKDYFGLFFFVSFRYEAFALVAVYAITPIRRETLAIVTVRHWAVCCL